MLQKCRYLLPLNNNVGDFRIPGLTPLILTPYILTRGCERGRLKSLVLLLGDNSLWSGRVYAMMGVMKAGVLREHIVAILVEGYASGFDGLHWAGDYPLDAAANVFCYVFTDVVVGFTFLGSMELSDP